MCKFSMWKWWILLWSGQWIYLLVFQWVYWIVVWNKYVRKKIAKPKNKRSMGHIAHLRKQFKSNNTYNYILTLIKRRKKTRYYLNKMNTLTQRCFVPSLVEIGPVVLEKKMKMWKVYRRKDRRTDGQRRRTTGAQKSSLELSAHVS